jgi:hypothetical protein
VAGYGLAARTPPFTEKNANTMFAFFSSSLPTATAVGCPSTFEPLMKGLRPEHDHMVCARNLFISIMILFCGFSVYLVGCAMWSGTGSKPNHCIMSGGSPAARGRDNIGNHNPPLKHDNLEGCEAPGWA